MNRRTGLVTVSVAFLLIDVGPDLLNAQSPDHWTFQEKVDQMDDTKSLQAVLHTRVSSNGRSGTVEVTATCAAEVVKLDVVYVSDTDKNMGFQQVQPDPSVFLNQINIPKPLVNMRMRIGDAPVKAISAQTDHVNEAILLFSELSPGQAMADMRGPQGSHDMTPLLRLFASGASAGTIDDLYNSRLIRLELPLANGDTPVVRITPHDDPDFQKFASRCKAAYPMIKETFISGGPAFSSALPSGITAVLGDHRLIPSAGARFVPVTEEEAKEIVIRAARSSYDYDPRAREGQRDYAPAFKSAAILPEGTECSAVESSKPRFIVAARDQDPRARSLVIVNVGRGGVDLVKLADGRFGLIPSDDLSYGYTSWRRRLPDPLQAARPEPSRSELAPSDRRFIGTAEQFAAAFPDFLSRAAADWQLDPQSFAQESAYILDLARTCAEITPEMLDTVRNPANDDIDLQKLANGRFKKCGSIETYAIHQPRFQIFDLSSLSAAFAAKNQLPPEAFKDRGINIGGPGRHWGSLDGESFTLRIRFGNLPSDPRNANQPYPAGYWIVEATIRSSSAGR